jgi:hypothetical protein
MSNPMLVVEPAHHCSSSIINHGSPGTYLPYLPYPTLPRLAYCCYPIRVLDEA